MSPHVCTCAMIMLIYSARNKHETEHVILAFIGGDDCTRQCNLPGMQLNLKWWIKRSNGYHDESVHANDGNSMVYVMIIGVSYSCEMMKKCSWKQGQQKWKGHSTTSWRMPLLQTGMRDQPISIARRRGWTFVTVRIRATCNTRGGGRHAALLCSTHPRGTPALPLPTP